MAHRSLARPRFLGHAFGVPLPLATPQEALREARRREIEAEEGRVRAEETAAEAEAAAAATAHAEALAALAKSRRFAIAAAIISECGAALFNGCFQYFANCGCEFVHAR